MGVSIPPELWLSDYLGHPPSVKPDALSNPAPAPRNWLAEQAGNVAKTVAGMFDPRGSFQQGQDLAQTIGTHGLFSKQSAMGLAMAAPMFFPEGSFVRGAANPEFEDAVARQVAASAEHAGQRLPRSMPVPSPSDRFAVLTGENPFGTPSTKKMNVDFNRALRARMTDLGLAYTPVEGEYPDFTSGNRLKENSYLVHDVHPTLAMQLGREFNQNSVVTPKGFHDLAGGATAPSKGIVPSPDDFITKLPGGASFKIDPDFENMKPIPPVSKAVPAAPAVHIPGWQPVRRGVFDPSQAGLEYREPRPLPFNLDIGSRAGVDPLAARIAEHPDVERVLHGDVEAGLKAGGLTWYGLKPIRDFFEEHGGSFDDFNHAGGAGSINTPTHNELANASLLMYMKKRPGMAPTQAVDEMIKQVGLTKRPTFMPYTMVPVFERASEQGALTPPTPTSGDLKVPNYGHNRALGAMGVPLDTHEITRLAQSLNLPFEVVSEAVKRNAASYHAATMPYRRIAANLGLAPDQVQASRWLGGGLRTGLQSQPTGDFMQTVEDGLRYTALQRGMNDTPHDLSNLMKQIARGDAFFAPYFGKGGFPRN